MPNHSTIKGPRVSHPNGQLPNPKDRAVEIMQIRHLDQPLSLAARASAQDDIQPSIQFRRRFNGREGATQLFNSTSDKTVWYRSMLNTYCALFISSLLLFQCDIVQEQ
ncbi:hypothetical protein LOAG_11858 [Loa loa]|uniref:Transmembrane protein n=1 Tax=Loa loa TaxID=7209 RepID=A0A1I7VZU4_LOALO|nr:hypothetical protein LOAG_11858 [Loa loa]EFO16646.1 hypothetical protein LOAG_11858 [Loa loa]